MLCEDVDLAKQVLLVNRDLKINFRFRVSISCYKSEVFSVIRFVGNIYIHRGLSARLA